MDTPSFNIFLTRLQAQTPIQNQSQLAHALGVGKAAVSLAKHKDQVPAKWILTLAEIYSLNSNWLATGRGSPCAEQGSCNLHSLSIIQVLPELHNEREFKPHPHGLQSSLILPASWLPALQHRELICLRMPGPCMEPELQEEDLLLIDRSSNEIYSGQIYAIGWRQSVLIRRVDEFAELTFIYADNPICPRIELNPSQKAQIRILGTVLCSCREFAAFKALPA
ncbi:MAG: S24 family peptidase [Desulfohalobiaceae bacterium]